MGPFRTTICQVSFSEPKLGESGLENTALSRAISKFEQYRQEFQDFLYFPLCFRHLGIEFLDPVTSIIQFEEIARFPVFLRIFEPSGMATKGSSNEKHYLPVS